MDAEKAKSILLFTSPADIALTEHLFLAVNKYSGAIVGEIDAILSKDDRFACILEPLKENLQQGVSLETVEKGGNQPYNLVANLLWVYRLTDHNRQPLLEPLLQDIRKLTQEYMPPQNDGDLLVKELKSQLDYHDQEMETMQGRAL